MAATINGVTNRGGPGSVFFYGSNDEHGMKNVGGHDRALPRDSDCHGGHAQSRRTVIPLAGYLAASFARHAGYSLVRSRRGAFTYQPEPVRRSRSTSASE